MQRDRRRGEEKNWYTLPMEERQRQMNEHGLVGRRYAGEVKQIITGSIGFGTVWLRHEISLAANRNKNLQAHLDEVSATEPFTVPMSIVAPMNEQTIMALKEMASHAGNCKARPASPIMAAAPSCMSTTKNFLVL